MYRSGDFEKVRQVGGLWYCVADECSYVPFLFVEVFSVTSPSLKLQSRGAQIRTTDSYSPMQ